MEQITIGILDDDMIYRKRLMEYLNHQGEYPMRAVSFANEEQVQSYMESNYLDGLISTRKPKEVKDIFCILLGDGREGTVDKYGNAAMIARYVYESLNLRQDEHVSVLGIYSVFGDERRTRLAMEIAKRYRGIYLGMEEYNSLNICSDKTEQLLFYIREHREDVMEFFKGEALDLGDCFGYPSALCYLDYRELKREDFHWFFQKVKEENLCLVVDIGTGSLCDLEILTLFDKVYLPVEKAQQGSKRYENFEQLVHTVGNLQSMQRQEVWLTRDDDMREVACRL